MNLNTNKKMNAKKIAILNILIIAFIFSVTNCIFVFPTKKANNALKSNFMDPKQEEFVEKCKRELNGSDKNKKNIDRMFSTLENINEHSINNLDEDKKERKEIMKLMLKGNDVPIEHVCGTYYKLSSQPKEKKLMKANALDENILQTIDFETISLKEVRDQNGEEEGGFKFWMEGQGAQIDENFRVKRIFDVNSRMIDATRKIYDYNGFCELAWTSYNITKSLAEGLKRYQYLGRYADKVVILYTGSYAYFSNPFDTFLPLFYITEVITEIFQIDQTAQNNLKWWNTHITHTENHLTPQQRNMMKNIHAFHNGQKEWLTGSVAKTDAHFAFFYDTIDQANYKMVNFNGEDLDFRTYKQYIWNLHGSLSNFDFSIFNMEYIKDMGNGKHKIQYWMDCTINGVKSKTLISSLDITEDSTGSHGFRWDYNAITPKPYNQF